MDKVAYWEQQWMILMDQYTQLVRELGILDEDEFDAWFGDPLMGHKEIVKRIKEKYGK
jgi:hypothetical protein